MKKLVEHYCELPQSIRPTLWRVWHEVLNLLDSDYSQVFLNYGYASPNGEFDDLKLQKRDEPDRYGIQLYQHLTRGAALENTSVLEVGCGRGGGASFLARYRKPREYVALDISERLVAYCSRFHQVSGLRFVSGTATHLPFEAGRFDAVVNVESARCYGDIGAFFQETQRVLKPGGFFFFADMIKNGDVERTHALLQKNGFDILRQKDIRENVVLALRLDAEARRQVIDERVPAWLRHAFYEFAGVEGSNRFRAFASNEMQYRSYVLQKK
jgi:ubiquinone/menaquinone biosynthesis C-methylase UbiE